MLKSRIEQELNKQLNKEFFSAYLYMSMAAYFQSVDLLGFANWITVQAKEEMLHAEKIYNFIHERNGKVVLEQLEKPQTEWDSPLAAFENSLSHEIFITDSINELVNIALEEKDHATNIFLQWFVTEQVEEESNATEIIRKIKLMKDAPGGMFLLDKELATRTLVVPAV
ncbi:MAG: ferritin [Candidatus Melainabacteria bacterium GWA2_34_9]|nr:MAG: ferritin [Candidatus Melainabacteria bacterium GWA2_34_9]